MSHTPRPAAGPGPGDPAAARAHEGLVAALARAGLPADPAWRAAFAAVPRHLFVPSYHALLPAGGHERLAADDPDPAVRERWLRGVYEDTALAIEVHQGSVRSSSSQPSLTARMLDVLEVEDGHRALEIGTGSGYQAALLAHRLGDARVTSVDLDESLVDAARARLAAAGHRPAVLAGDGVRGCPERAPFDRIVATCALPSVPRSWPEQCAPGAVVVAPLSTGLLVLRVRDGRRAEGRFLRTPVSFVPLRGEGGRPPRPYVGGLPKAALEDEGFRFMLALTTGRLDPHEALSLWRREGRPERDRFGITVSGDHEWAWLDDPAGPYAWPL
ncbi:methyltransferase domain-containing protein [Streptomyces sp. NPDC060194]|uniref:methyltransferase domain-containing protein n=1 Tax=Streptomyces sp. NPDC060194 TaxID=3347069 RepID=UPI00365F561C